MYFWQIFDWSDRLVTTILMPLGALSMSLFVGWFMPKLHPALTFALRWIVPAAILLIFLNGIGIL